MQGAKAYILPAVAALLLLGWWLFGPSLDDTASETTPAADGAAAPDPAPRAGPLDTALDAAIAGCGEPTGITELHARIGRDAEGQAAIETVTLTPPDASGATADCLRALAGTSLPTKAPVAAVDRRRTFGP